MKNRIRGLVGLAALLAGLTAGTPGAASAGRCPGPVVATWKLGGVEYPSSTALAAAIGPTWQLTLTDCLDDGADHVITIAGLPSPVAVGSVPLRFRLLHGRRSTELAGASYSATGGGAISAETNYFTDDAHSGQFAVTRVDAGAGTFDATFTFRAVNDAGSGVVEITEGRITGARLPG